MLKSSLHAIFIQIVALTQIEAPPPPLHPQDCGSQVWMITQEIDDLHIKNTNIRHGIYLLSLLNYSCTHDLSVSVMNSCIDIYPRGNFVK